MQRPIGTVFYLSDLISEYIYYDDGPSSRVSFEASQVVDETTDIFRLEDVERVIGMYFKGPNKTKVMQAIQTLAKSYGWDNQFIPEEVLYEGQGNIPYYLGVLPQKRITELALENLRDD